MTRATTPISPLDYTCYLCVFYWLVYLTRIVILPFLIKTLSVCVTLFLLLMSSLNLTLPQSFPENSETLE